MSERDPETLARAYYESLDAGDYDRLASVLAEDFRQVRGDQSFEGRGTFVRFMRDDRPNTDTIHEVDEIYRTQEGDDVAVRGRLLRADGTFSFGFVDVFEVDEGRLARLTTYTNRRLE